MAEQCLLHGMDLSGLLLLHSSLGDAEGISKLASLAKDQGKHNVAFMCLFMLGKLEDCIELLVESDRIPEAALMARSYLPSKVSQIVPVWKNNLNKVSRRAAEALADPAEYPNLFEDWQIAQEIEAKVAENRGIYRPADQYLAYTEQSCTNLVEKFKKMQIDEVVVENGDVDLKEMNEDRDYENQDADSANGVVVINDNEREEKLYTDDKRTSSPSRQYIYQSSETIHTDPEGHTNERGKK